MERLTDKELLRSDYEPWELCEMDWYCSRKFQEGGCKDCNILKTYKKLAEYEDLEEQGKLLKLPCKVGDTVYQILERNNVIKKALIKTIEMRLSGITYFALIIEENCRVAYFNFDFGKTVFLSQAEAEATLRKMEEENDKK